MSHPRCSVSAMTRTALTHPVTVGFPFGRPMTECEPDLVEPRPVLVLGGYARPLRVCWTPPSGPPVPALPVDTEPTPFWEASDAPLTVRRWQREVGWTPEWGRVAPAAGSGAGGRWLARDVLAPLGLERDDCWAAYAVPYVALPMRTLRQVDDDFYAFSRAAALPPRKPYLLQRGRRRALAVARDSAARFDDLFARADPELVVTVGTFADIVFMGYVVDAAATAGRALECEHEAGPVVRVRVGERTLRWVMVSRHDSGPRTRRVMREVAELVG